MNRYFTREQQNKFDESMVEAFIKAIERTKGKKLTVDERLECEELMEFAKATGRKAASAARRAERKCKYCECPIDNGLEHEWKKALPTHFPKLLKGRLAYGFQRDKDGEWMHTNAWQCILAFEAAEGPYTLPDKQFVWGDEEQLAESDTDNAQEN